MENSKNLTLTKLDGSTVEVVLKTQVSAWDDEKVNDVYSNYMKYNEETGIAKLDYNRGVQIAREKEHVLIELFTVSFGEMKPVKAEEVLKSLSRQEYAKLLKEIETIYDSQRLDDKKKEILPNNSSEASQPVKEETPAQTPNQ